MQPEHDKEYSDHFNNELDLKLFFNILLQGKWIIISVTTFVSILGLIFSLSLPNVYQSKALLVSVNSSADIPAAYSSLAGLAGISFPANSTENNSSKAKVKMTSLSFFENNIMKNIYLPDLMAFQSWNHKSNTVTYDENLFDSTNGTWIREYSYPKQQIPTPQESFKVFISKHISVRENVQTGFITLSIKHQSPFIAKEWTNLIVDEINSFYRKKDKLESERAVSYLKQQISITSLSEVKEALAMLLQEEIKKLTLIEANDFYVFDYINPPAVMEKKLEPNRALICILISLIGGILGIFIVLIKHYVFGKKTL